MSIQRKGKASTLTLLITCIASTSLLLMVVDTLFELYSSHGIQALMDRFCLPGTWRGVASRPWSVVTYLFIHNSGWHLLVNMALLWLFGKLLQTELGGPSLLRLFFTGGILSGLCYPLLFSFLDLLHVAVLRLPLAGASGGIMAVIMGIACYNPHERLRLFSRSIPLFYVALVFMILGCVSLSTNNLAGMATHLGGALWGSIYGVLLRTKRYDITRLSFAFTLSSPTLNSGKRANEDDSSRELLRIHDKIKYSGYSSLSDSERQYLFHSCHRKGQDSKPPQQ